MTTLPLWRDAPLVGRDDLIGELVARANAVAGGDAGSIVLLTGEAGVGKTSAVRALSSAVRTRLEVTSGTCVADQSAPPFWPWYPLVERPLAASLPPPDRAVGATRFELLAVVRDHVGASAGARPRLHVIEDLQWADVASVLLLGQLEGLAREAPLLVVATMRTGESSSDELDHAIADVRRACVVRELHPLADEDMATLVRSAGFEPDRQLLELMRDRTGGNPLFLTELLRAIPSRESAARRRQLLEELVPANVSDLVARRVRRLPASVADLLVTAATIGAAGEVAPLALIEGVDATAAVDLLEQARAAHLLAGGEAGRWRFRHELVRDAVYESVPQSSRARAHARVVAVLLADPTTVPRALAHHALAAAPFFDSGEAARLAAAAGRQALAQLAYEEAVMWFERALAAAGSAAEPAWRAEILVACGGARRHSGDIDGARELFIRAAALTGDPALLAEIALGHADPGADLGIAYRAEDSATLDLLERALAAQTDEDTTDGVQLEARLAAELYFSDQPSRSRQLAFDALDRARRLDDVGALGVATAVVHDAFVVGQASIAEQLEGAAQLLEWARATNSAAALLAAHRARVMVALAAGDMPAVETAIVAFGRIADPLQVRGYSWWRAMWSAMRALLDGRHELAEQRALEAFQIGEAPFPALAFTNLSFLLFFLRREQGRLSEMEQATRDYAESRADVPAIRVALTFLLAELGRLDEAATALRQFDEDALARLHDRNWPVSWFQLARAASLVGDHQLAATLLAPQHRPSEPCVQVSLATVCLGATDLAAAWLFQTTGELDRAIAHYESATDLNARIGARSWLAQTRADHAQALIERNREGDRHEAARLLRLAREAAAEIGLATVVAIGPGASSPVDGDRRSVLAVFRRSGSVWEIDFGNRAARIPDARGLRDIAHLLARPGEAVSALELLDDVEHGVARGAPVLDERARREIRERLAALDRDEADADAVGAHERAALVREQRRELAELVARDFGLGGRSRSLGDPIERARKTVSTRIRRTIAAIGRVHAELGRHLDRSIDTGTWCSYRPAEPIDWQT